MAPGSLWLLDGVPVVLEPGVVEVVAESAVEADVFSERAFDCTGGVGVETVVAADGVVLKNSKTNVIRKKNLRRQTGGRITIFRENKSTYRSHCFRTRCSF